MDVTPELAKGAKPINGYGSGFFRVGEDVVNGPILLHPERVAPAPVASVDQLTPDIITQVCRQEPVPQVLLLGLGPTFDQLPPKELRLAAKAAGVILEPMDTGAACRTWNVLLSEGRRITALLWPV